MIVLGVIELRRRQDFSRDRDRIRGAQLSLKLLPGSFGALLLLVGVGVDAGPILRA